MLLKQCDLKHNMYNTKKKGKKLNTFNSCVGEANGL